MVGVGLLRPRVALADKIVFVGIKSVKFLFSLEFKMAYVGRTEFTLMSSICKPQKRKTPTPARKCHDIMLLKIQYIIVLPLDAAFAFFFAEDTSSFWPLCSLETLCSVLLHC